MTTLMMIIQPSTSPSGFMFAITQYRPDLLMCPRKQLPTCLEQMLIIFACYIDGVLLLFQILPHYVKIQVNL
jgi:hypothetical protein